MRKNCRYLDSGYDIELFENVPDPEFICTICHGVLKDPVELLCQHVFCRGCVMKWLTEKQECPYCRKKVRRVARSVIPMIHNMIARLIVKCENRVYGCWETFSLEHYPQHKAACDFRIVKCKHEACTIEVFQKNLAAHEQVCEHWSQPCRMGCGVQLTPNQLSEHNCYKDVKRKYKEKIRVLKSRLHRTHCRLKLAERILQDLGPRDCFQLSKHLVYEDDENEDLAAEDHEEDHSNILVASEYSENESLYSWHSSDLDNGEGPAAVEDELDDTEDECLNEAVTDHTTEDTISISSSSSTEHEANCARARTHLYFETDDGSNIASENVSSFSGQDASNRKRFKPWMLQCSMRSRKAIWKRSNLKLLSRRQHSRRR
ncbi:RING finger protein 151 isoform X2 [Stegostoma tigrinum]|uniref:RING finger protein 151 isoform X2 n=1 Tax=Stegostoma tigrinum TaxID=3053191 RepID=UPI00202B65E5|nr:RING finger protein 151 isoform X2 [Stegostoma tigrinum]